MKFLLVLALVAAATAQLDRSKVIPLRNRNPSTRITGGNEVTPHSVPYQVGLFIPYQGGSAFCGGSLIAPTWVLTAAHCGELSTNITVVLGAHYINNRTEPTQIEILSKRVIVHEAWDSTTLVNDIALIELVSAAPINDNIKTVRLPSRSEQSNNFAGMTGTATGWGLDSDNADTISPVLRTVDVPVINNAQCRIEFGLIGALLPLHETNICISGKGGKSTCNGDSGGPLTVPLKNNAATVIGLTSFGISLGCEKDYPAVFTRITGYLDWISLESGLPVEP